MLLELAKALSFFISLLSFYPVALSAFFIPAAGWQERLEGFAIRLTLSGLLCLLSAMLFVWPARSNPAAGQPLTASLPLRLFFWATGCIALLFAISWYSVCGSPNCGTIGHDCGCSFKPL